MRKSLIAIVSLISLGAVPPSAHAIGCLSGGAAGALAGHMAGHGILGALSGCIAGHQWHKHQVNKQGLQNTQQYDQQRKAADPNYQSPWSQQ
jgi:outer membrane lipoprotein SlyB